MQKNQGINFLGRVIDQEKQAPLSGIKVLLNFPGAPPFVYTDLEGIYRFPVKFDGTSSLKGEITIEGKGYRTLKYIIELLPNKKDIGDIRLLRPDSKTGNIQLLHPDSKTRVVTSTETESGSMLLPIIVAVMTGLAIIIAVATKPLPQATPQEIPVKIRTYHIKKPHKSFKNSSLIKKNCRFDFVPNTVDLAPKTPNCRVGTAHLPKQLMGIAHPTSV